MSNYSKQSVLNNTAASNTAVVITVPAATDVRRYIRKVWAVFDDDSGNTSATLTVSSGGTEIVNTYISMVEPRLDLGLPGLAGEPGESVVVTLGAVTGKIGRLTVFVDES